MIIVGAAYLYVFFNYFINLSNVYQRMPTHNILNVCRQKKKKKKYYEKIVIEFIVINYIV